MPTENNNEELHLIISGLIASLKEYEDDAVARTRGYRLVCQASGHGSPRTYVGPCRATQSEARTDMRSHANAHHGGSTAGMTYSGRCDISDSDSKSGSSNVIETQVVAKAISEMAEPQREGSTERATDYYRAHCFQDGYIGTWGNIFWGIEQARAHDIDHHGGSETCRVDHKRE